MKQLLASLDSTRVPLIRSVLDAAQITYEIRNDTMSQVLPTVLFAAELWVQDEDYDEVNQLLANER